MAKSQTRQGITERAAFLDGLKSKTLEELIGIIAEMYDENGEQEKVINDLSDKVVELEAKPAGAGPIIIEHKSAKYQVNIPRFQHEGKVYDAADLKTNTALVESLIKMGSAVLAKV